MNKVPCRKCPNCGTYNDLTVDVCSCGNELKNVNEELIDINDIPTAQRGVIDTERSFFVQTCPSCGALRYTADKEKGHTRCFCTKTRIKNSQCISLEEFFAKDESQQPKDEPCKGTLGSGAWVQGIGEKIQSVVDNNPSDTPEVDDEEKTVSWADLGLFDDKEIIVRLTSAEDSSVSDEFTASADEFYRLGREAHFADFLSDDFQVSGVHCYIYREGDVLKVKDTSINGTFVNGCDIGLNGEAVLNDGAVLTLGHKENSHFFLVSVK